MSQLLIYNASAGSGKTYTLVREYLKLVMANPGDFRHTLAITFTNKAAEEMKTRIIEKLGELAQGKDPLYKNRLIKDGIGPDIEQMSSQLLSEILHNYSYFSVSTIDSFFHKVIRSFASDLGLQLGYTVELDQASVLEKITDELFVRIGSDEKLRSYMENYIFFNIDEEGDWRVERKVKDLAAELFKERYWQKREGRDNDISEDRGKMLEFVAEFSKIVKAFESRMLDFSKEAQELADNYSLTIADFPFKEGGYGAYLLIKIPGGDFVPGKRPRNAAADINNMYAKNSPPNLRAAVTGGFHEVLANAVGFFDSNCRKYFTAKELTKTIYVLGIFKDMLDVLRDYRDENKLLLISDTNNILKTLMKDEPSPFVYEKIGNTFKHFLVDEFQDTSNYQWDNLLPLLENSLSEGNTSMIVGDVKQSIYRWRGGNMLLLLEKVQRDLAQFSGAIKVETLKENRRSLQEVIKFNNSFFGKAKEIFASDHDTYRVLIEKAYNDTKQGDDIKKKGGYVRVEFIPNDRESELTVNDEADKLTLSQVDELLKSGFERKDILILVNRKVEGFRIAQVLSGSGHSVISNESLLISASPKVKLILNVLKYITSHEDKIAQSEILLNYRVYLNNAPFDYYELFQNETGDLNAFRKKMPAGFEEIEFSSAGTSRSGSYSLYELIEKIITVFDIGGEPDSYLLRFMDAVLEYNAANNQDIKGFVEWMDDKKYEISILVPGEENAIRVMTIHKAKGLQSPAVIIPYANWDFSIKPNSIMWASAEEEPFDKIASYPLKAGKTLSETYFEKEYEDEKILTAIDKLNMLYVAFTRAIERLYINVPERKSTKINAGKLIRQVLAEGETGNIIESGKKEKKKSPDKKSALKQYRLESIITPNLDSGPVIELKGKDIDSLSPSKRKESIGKGLLLHEALSYVRTAGDTRRAIEKLITKGLVQEKEKELFIEELNEIVNSDTANEWFSTKWEVKSESELLLPDGKTLRPDRVLINDKSAVIIDYKTGESNPEHGAQVNKYADILTAAGYTNIRKYLYYISSRKVVEI